jgi:hypothetical protein
MNCHELKRKISFGQPERVTLLAMRRHAASCDACGKLLAAEHLTDALVRAVAAADEREAIEPSPFWTSRMRRRIQEMRDQRVHSWEAHVMALHRWLAALGAAAVLLLGVSFQMRPVQIATQTNHEELPGIEGASPQANVDELIGEGEQPAHKSSNLYE